MDAAPNNDTHRSRRSEFLMVPSMPFGGPIMSGVRRLRSK
jgi:hypothetical protein